MIRLEIVAGRTAGTAVVARRFPFMIGRRPSAGLSLTDSGVWEEHAEILLHQQTFSVRAGTGALLIVNGQPLSQGPIRNGDLLELGSARVRFWLEPARQKPLGWREAIVWILILAVLAAQLVAIYWLL